MKKLTGIDELGYYFPLNVTLNCLKHRGECVDRLGAYEDTGLTPERCAELAEADKDGRLVVLPCKVGDCLYALTRDFVSQFTCTAMEVLQDGSVYIRWRLERGITGAYRVDGTDASEFGKTVFLTREEAEAALREAKKDG